MKYKLMLGFILSSLLSANSFAIQINGGKLLSHKEWTKGNVIKSSFKDVKPSDVLNIPSLQRLQQNEGSNWIFAYGNVVPLVETSVPVNTDVTLSGNSHVYIFNHDTVQRTYTTVSYTHLDVYKRQDVCY